MRESCMVSAIAKTLSFAFKICDISLIRCPYSGSYSPYNFLSKKIIYLRDLLSHVLFLELARFLWQNISDLHALSGNIP